MTVFNTARLLCLFCVMTIVTSAFANAQSDTCSHVLDEYTQIDTDLRIAITQCDNKPPKAVALFITGWAAHLDGVGDLFVDTAKAFAHMGIVSLRTDIRGESEQEKSNYTLTSTYASRVHDAQIALEHLKKQFPSLPVIVLGHSLGGTTALSLAANDENHIDNLVLWSYAGNPDSLFPRMLSEQQHREVMTQGSVTLNTWANLIITKEHYLGMNAADIYPPLRSFTGKLLYLVGSDEPQIYEESRLYDNLVNAERVEKVLVVGADHIYNVFDSSKTHSQRVIQLTRDWLKDTVLE